MSNRSVRKTTTVTKSSSSSASSRAATRGSPASFRASAVGGSSASSFAAGGDDDGDVEYSFEMSASDGQEDLGTSLLSPTRSSRLNEKKQLCHLNDRLASYIERVRQLESENQRLNVQIRTSEETITRERGNIKAAFQAELQDARRLLDETAKEKARLQIEADKARAEYDNQRSQIARLEKELKDSEKRSMYSESLVQDLQAKLNNADNERKHADDNAKRLQKENDNLKRQLETARGQLEEETLLRVDLENRLQSMREELAFNKQLYDQELEETRQKRQTEITEIGRDLEDQYQLQLREQLQQMRAQFDAQLRRNRTEIEDMYEAKLKSMQEQVERARDTAGSSRDELISLRSKVDTLEKERNKYQSMVEGLERKLKDLEGRLKLQADDFYSQLGRKEEDLRRLRDEIARMMTEYQDLMDTKIQLDVEIEAYRRLLEGEESRLNLSAEMMSSAGSESGSSSRRGVKRRRVVQERETEALESYNTKAEHQGDIEILDHDIAGNFIKIRNNGKNDEGLGNWHLRRVAGEDEVSYKFASRSQLKAGQTLIVWAKSSGTKHAPSDGDYVMKDNMWPTGESIRTTLTNSDDEEMAWRESSRSTSTHRYSFRTGGGSAAYSHAIESADPDQRCSVM